MAPEITMDVKTFLSFKTCKFNYFLKFLQNCLNLAYFSSSTKQFFFLTIQNGRKIQYGRFFAQKFMNEMLQFLDIDGDLNEQRKLTKIKNVFFAFFI
jgi:hypothetical protein